MSVIRSISASELTSGNCKDMSIGNQELSCTGIESSNADRNSKDPLLNSKAQTLDRFARPSMLGQHGEKRKKNFFASFRLNKKSIGKKKDDQSSSGSDLSHSLEKTDEHSVSHQKVINDDEEFKHKDRDSSNQISNTRRRYLNRMSSFVSKVAYKVQSGNESNHVLKNKLERSQTITGTDFSSQKTECVQFENNQVPGLMGIRNHGNTCFINAVIQCLSHTDVLAEYFVLDYFKSDLARCNRINSKKYGTRGEITEHLSSLLKSLWILRYIPDISLNLKNVVEKYELCYRGSNQHDAAEFLMFILDKVHEDLNTASKRKYKKIKNSYGRPDEVVAAETLANHLRCNSSFIQDIFQAQFRSSLKCPHCLKESNTFDPYLCVSIPIPQYEILAIFVTVVYLNQQPKQVKIGIHINASSTIKQLRQTISEDCGIKAEELIITEIDGEGFHRTFADNASVSIIKSSDPIYAIELTPPNTSMQENGSFIHIVWVNVLLADPSDIRFGGVCQSQVARDITYPDLQKLLLKEMSAVVTLDTLVQEQDRGLFLIGVDTGSKNLTILEPDLDLPFLHQSVEEALSLCHPLAGPLHIKLILQWISETKEKYIVDDVDHVDEHSSVEELKKKPTECAPVSLSDCLQLHTSAEMLSCGDAWHCPTCNRKQQVLKRLTLWSAPQILVIHLKRFRQVSLSSNSSKLNTVVNFPLTGFDISDHITGRYGSSTNNTFALNNTDSSNNVTNKTLSGVWSPWKRAKKFNLAGNDHVYDLYAICNHHGEDLQGGHYTAVCRNPTNDRWYAFDDFNIEEIAEESVVDQDAYILFYQRRDDISSSISEGADHNHWSYRIPLKSVPQTLKIIPSSVEEKETDDKLKETVVENFANSVTVNKDETQIIHRAEEPNGLVAIHKSEIPISADESLSKTSFKIEKVKVDIMSSCEEKKRSSVVEIHNVPCDTDSLIFQENCTPSFDKTRSSNVSLKIKVAERLSSFMMDTIETSDIVNTQSVDRFSKSHCTESLCNNGVNATPDVRIQPASLEVLASHRYKSCPSVNQSSGEVLLRPKAQEKTDSRPLSTSSCSSRSSDSFTNHISSEYSQEKVMNGYTSETGCSTSSDETPEIIINSTRTLLKHRQPNTNKTPSFVVIRTPSASPRSNISKGGKCSVTNSCNLSETMNGTAGRSRVRETYPSALKSETKYSRERTLSFSGRQGNQVDSEFDFKVLNKKILVNGKANQNNGYGIDSCQQKTCINDSHSDIYCDHSSQKSEVCGVALRGSSSKAKVSSQKRLEQHNQINGIELSKNCVNGYKSRSHQMLTDSNARSSFSKQSSDLCSYNKPCIVKYRRDDQFNQYVTESSV